MNLQVNRNLALEQTADAEHRPQSVALGTDARAELAAQFIPAGSRVLDIACGGMALQRLLPTGCSYQGCDRIARGGGSIVCDFDAGDFPTQAAAQSDIIVMLGALEQIADVESFFTHLRFCKQDVVLSYCATDLTGTRDREALGFANALSFYDLALLFDRYGFRIECTAPIDDMQVLMRLTPTEKLMPVTPCSVRWCPTTTSAISATGSAIT
jgi:hypothetical protein